MLNDAKLDHVMSLLAMADHANPWAAIGILEQAKKLLDKRSREIEHGLAYHTQDEET